MPLYHQKEKEKENQKKRNIKSRKIDKRKRKMLVSKHTITLSPSLHSSSASISNSIFISFF